MQQNGQTYFQKEDDWRGMAMTFSNGNTEPVHGADHAGRYVFEISPPLGWHVPPTLPPPGALRLTVGGLPTGEAPASMMIRPLAKGGDDFETFAQREIEAMQAAVPDGAVEDLEGVEFPGKRWIARQIRDRHSHKTAVVTLLDEGDHFVWFGLLVTDKTQMKKAPLAFLHVLRSFRTQRYSALVESLRQESW